MARQRRKKGRPVSGWLVLDKPKGMGSTDAVSKIKWLYGAEKAGHAGTLDPLASGMLPIALGEATKTVPYVQDGAKVYRFTVAWGEERTTDDLEGAPTKTSSARPGEAEIRAAMPKYTGVIMQTPPQFSAIKIAGERAYDLAREGETVEIPAREVEIGRFDLIAMPDAGTAVFEIECGKGTYVRSIARDLGRDLQDRARALGEALHQPGRVRPVLGDEGLLVARLRTGRDARVIGAVRQHARQCLGVQLDDPAVVLGAAHQHVGHHRGRGLGLERRTRFRIEPLQLGDHVGEVLGIDLAGRHQRTHVAPRQEIEIVEQGRHRRIVAVQFAQLDLQALAQGACEHARRVEALHAAEHGLDPLAPAAERAGERVEIEGEPPGRVEGSDQTGADQPVGRVGDGQPELLGQVLAQGAALDGQVLDIATILFEIGPPTAPAGTRGPARAGRVASIGRAAGVIDIAEIGIERRLARGSNGVTRIRERRGFLGCRGRRNVRAWAVIALEQRVALELLLDPSLDLEIGELEELDRLPQLRRHHQRLAEAEIEPRTDRHAGGSPAGP